MKTYVNVSQAAKMLGISRPTLYRLLDQGALAVYRNPLYKNPGGPVLIARSELEEFARQHGVILRELSVAASR